MDGGTASVDPALRTGVDASPTAADRRDPQTHACEARLQQARSPRRNGDRRGARRRLVGASAGAVSDVSRGLSGSARTAGCRRRLRRRPGWRLVILALSRTRLCRLDTRGERLKPSTGASSTRRTLDTCAAAAAVERLTLEAPALLDAPSLHHAAERVSRSCALVAGSLGSRARYALAWRRYAAMLALRSGAAWTIFPRVADSGVGRLPTPAWAAAPARLPQPLPAQCDADTAQRLGEGRLQGRRRR